MTIDGLSLKIQGKHYYDCTIHHVCVEKAENFGKSSYTIKTSTILFVEGLLVASAANIRGTLDRNLCLQFGLDFYTIRKCPLASQMVMR